MENIEINYYLVKELPFGVTTIAMDHNQIGLVELTVGRGPEMHGGPFI